MEVDFNQSDITLNVNKEWELTKNCTNSNCEIEDKEIRTLQCSICKRRVHYRCSLLPTYQIQRFVMFGTGYSKFVCVNCVDITSDLVRETNTSESNNDLELKYQKERERSNNLKAEIQKFKEILQEKDGELLKLSNKLETLENRMTTSTKRRRIEEEENLIAEEHYTKIYNESQKKNLEIERLKKDNENLNERLTERETELDETLQKLADSDCPNAEKNKNKSLIEKIEISIQNRFDVLQQDLKILIDEKINDKSNNVGNVSYASAITYEGNKDGNTQQQKINQMKNATEDFRTIMMSTRNEELAEEREKKLRSCNIIIHGSDENNPEKPDDNFFVNNMFLRIGLDDISPKSIVRLGNSAQNTKRPIKVILQSEREKEKVMSNLFNLKGKNMYKGISVTEDYTISERQMIKNFTSKGKERNSAESDNTDYVWKVCGTPKNGLVLKRFKKSITNPTS